MTDRAWLPPKCFVMRAWVLKKHNATESLCAVFVRKSVELLCLLDPLLTEVVQTEKVQLRPSGTNSFTSALACK